MSVGNVRASPVMRALIASTVATALAPDVAEIAIIAAGLQFRRDPQL